MDWRNPNKKEYGPGLDPVESETDDVLRGRFTKWLDVVLYRAKLKYLRKLSQEIETVSLDELIDSGFQPEAPDSFAHIERCKRGSFEFEEERLAAAFRNLPIKRPQILEMLFIEQMKPEEIARVLNCSVQHIYNRRSSALKALRFALKEEGKENDQ